MRTLWKVIIGIVAVVLVVAGILVYFGYGLQDVSYQGIEFKGVRSIGLRSFTLEAELSLHNPSDLSVPVREVTYDIIQKSNGQVVSSGVIPIFVLEADKSTAIPFEQEVLWGPTSALALELATEDKVYLTVKGKAYLDVAGAREKAIEFEKDVEIKQYLPGGKQEEPQEGQEVLPGLLE